MVKNLPADAGDRGFIPVSGSAPGGGNGNPLQYSCLEKSMDRGGWWALVHGIAKSWTELSDSHRHNLVRIIPRACPVSFSDGKLYDAYVLYPKPQRESQSHDVDTLVLKILPEVLEKQCGYKLFIFGRDEFPGQGMFSVRYKNKK